jgi:nucleoside-diphosphate-sugar epimerase/predicted dehydrogenase
MKRVCLVGAGFISHIHAEVLRSLEGIVVAAVVDPNKEAADALANRWSIPRQYDSVNAALVDDAFDCAHVLVPPNLHRDTALPILAAAKPVLMEKPLAASSAECEQLLAASAGVAKLGVNQNFLFHPSLVRLREMIASRALGNLRFVDCIYNMPLRQLAARQFGHWMFDSAANILLEQAVHPLSQIAALAGPIEDSRVLAGAPIGITASVAIHPMLTAALRCRFAPASFYFAVGQSFPCWQVIAVCDDGVMMADILSNSMIASRRTRWIGPVDGFVSGHRRAAQGLRYTWANAFDYVRSTFRLSGRRDPFFLSMKNSIAEFHASLDAGKVPESDGHFGASLVRICESIGDQLPTAHPVPSSASSKPRSSRPSKIDVTVLGGTGFIGRHLTKRLVDQGLRVAVMARNTRNLPESFQVDGVNLIRGDVRSAPEVERAIEGATRVVNLAHGGGGRSWSEVHAAMVGSAETVANACLAKGVARLVHVGSIASLYLGPQKALVSGATPLDSKPDRRADYARAKILCDRLLLEMHAHNGLPVCILRPGIVVGDGGSPFHSGIGFYNTEQHCIGWNAGRNPLPLVLVDDIAEAIVAAIDAKGIEGRCYNLVGEVRLTAREYIEELARALGRPLRYHPKSPMMLWLEDLSKWTIKRVAGLSGPLPSRHDILSRGMMAVFDCSDAMADLDWHPITDRENFLRRAMLVHAQAA